MVEVDFFGIATFADPNWVGGGKCFAWPANLVGGGSGCATVGVEFFGNATFADPNWVGGGKCFFVTTEILFE